MKLGILGGSFNPVHFGHLFLADMVLSKLKLDRVIFVPAYRSPFKLDAEGMGTNANDRIDMLSCAIIGDSRFALDSCEIRREGVSYTVNTIEDIIVRYQPTGKPVLIIGDDLAADFPDWHESGKILQLADIAVARRINTNDVKYSFPHIVIKNEVMNVSSKTIRQRISEESVNAESGWRSLVPSGVRAIIEDRQLYGYSKMECSEDCAQANILRIETAVREALSTERFLHSRSTALHASDMCRRFGLDPAAGYLAGIAHDFAKQIDGKNLLKIAKSAGIHLTSLEKVKPSLLHGKVSAVLLRERFCVHNKDILEAVAYHTSGCENMGPLAKVIYIADKTESSRNIDPALRKLCKEADLDSILYTVLEKTVVKLQARELDLSEDTLMLLNKMKGRKH